MILKVWEIVKRKRHSFGAGVRGDKLLAGMGNGGYFTCSVLTAKAYPKPLKIILRTFNLLKLTVCCFEIATACFAGLAMTTIGAVNKSNWYNRSA